MIAGERAHVMDQPERSKPAGVLAPLLEFGPQDWLVLGYLCVLNLAGLMADPHPLKLRVQLEVLSLLLVLVVTLVLVRWKIVKDNWICPLVYRLAIYGTVQLSYFFFRNYLPVVNPRALDLSLYELDLRFFGFEPAIWLDRFVTPLTTEWFAFFYFGYFFVLAVHVIPILFLVRRTRLLGEFTLGMLTLFCTGHVLYMLVPGFGPFRAMPEYFQHPFPSGLWLDDVMATVSSSGAQKDIFPSLHTGAPTFITLFSYRHRGSMPFKYTWPVMAIFAINIIPATMFLRWHYLVDVVAGLFLAMFAQYVAARWTNHEIARRDRLALSPSWPLFGRPLRK